MQLPVTYVFTHDSIAVGEDGPTHEPIEQLAALRAMPNVSVIRPADGNESVAAWRLARIYKQTNCFSINSSRPSNIRRCKR